MDHHPLLGIAELAELEPYLGGIGQLFTAFRDQDSGCVSYGVRLAGGERWFVKEAVTAAARQSLERGWAFHRAVRHPVIVPQVHRFRVGDSTAVVLPWREGEVLYHPTAHGPRDRTGPASAMARFRALPVADVVTCIAQVVSAHLAVEAVGHVAVDFYDGAMLYDFALGSLCLIDLDEYRPGPFVVEADRLPGSRRFMAPEEFTSGAVVDARTTVFTLGRAARLLLDAGDSEEAWRGSAAQLAVVTRATRPNPDQRFGSVGEFAAEWRAATSR